jgi:hypothetical protein
VGHEVHETFKGAQAIKVWELLFYREKCMKMNIGLWHPVLSISDPAV